MRIPIRTGLFQVFSLDDDTTPSGTSTPIVQRIAKRERITATPCIRADDALEYDMGDSRAGNSL
jgi:hypothetical protein